MLLDPRFKYIPAARTDVSATWRRFGFKPTTDAERRSRKPRGEPGSDKVVAAAATATRPPGAQARGARVTTPNALP